MSNKLTVTYKGTPIINEKEIEGDATITYKGSTVQTITPGNEVKLNTKNKYTSDFITIAGEKLNTTGKIIKDFINVKVVNNINYLCFTAQENNSTVKLETDTQYGPITVLPTLEYSTDLINWQPFITDITVVTLNTNNKMWLRGNNPYITPPGSDVGTLNFKMTGKIAASGNIMSLLDETCQLKTITSSCCFYRLFLNCSSLITPPELPATTIGEYAYCEMFRYCTNLITAPALPATTATEDGCYASMFSECYNLITIPQILLQDIPDYNCYNMFNGCSKICLSTVQDTTYKYEYRIPASGTGTAGSSALMQMFTRTGGTFTGTPNINTTYYTSNEIV